MLQPIQVGTCLNVGACKHFIDYEDSTRMLSGYEIYNNKEIYNSLDKEMKEHFYKSSDEYQNIIKTQEEEELQSDNEKQINTLQILSNLYKDKPSKRSLLEQCLNIEKKYKYETKRSFSFTEDNFELFSNNKDNYYKWSLTVGEILQVIQNFIESEKKYDCAKEICEIVGEEFGLPTEYFIDKILNIVSEYISKN